MQVILMLHRILKFFSLFFSANHRLQLQPRIMDDEFTLCILPTIQFDQFPIDESEFVIGLHADVTLLTALDDEFEDEDVRDFECTTQERFLYDKDLKLGRKDLINEKVCRSELVNALTDMEAIPEKYYDEIVDGVLEFVNYDERFNKCGGVSVEVELVKYAEFEDDESQEDDEEMEDDRIEPSFANVLADEEMCESKKCVICLDGFAVGIEVYKIKCQHVFHKKCLLNWLDRSVSCPLCRIEPPNFHVSPAEESCIMF